MREMLGPDLLYVHSKISWINVTRNFINIHYRCCSIFSGKSLPESTVTIVMQFYNDDRVSTAMPGMKDYVSCRNSRNQKIHVQKRLILSNLKELFEFFREEYPSIAIGFSSFAALRPEHCVFAGQGGTHTVCVCPIHQNVKLMMIGRVLSSIHPYLHQ